MKSAAKQRGVLQRPLAPPFANIKSKGRIFALLLGRHFHFIMQLKREMEEESRYGNPAETE
jgi:hypothetical protein